MKKIAVCFGIGIMLLLMPVLGVNAIHALGTTDAVKTTDATEGTGASGESDVTEGTGTPGESDAAEGTGTPGESDATEGADALNESNAVGISGTRGEIISYGEVIEPQKVSVIAVTGINIESDTFNPVESATSTVSVEGVALSEISLNLTEGEQKVLKATILPTNATNQNVEWKSSDTLVAKVDAEGNVTAVKEGIATIIVTTKDGNKTAICIVKVSANDSVIESITLDSHETAIESGKSVTLEVTIIPADVTGDEVVWSSSNESVATVKNGIVTGVSEGNAYITAKSRYGTCEDVCEVKVTSSTVEEEAEHDFGAPEFVWSNDWKSCHVFFTCKKDGYTEVYNAEVSSSISKAATCASKGVITYVAVYGGYVDAEDVEYEDETRHAGGIEIKGEKAASCEEEGYTGDVYCKGCGNKLSSGETIPKKKHDFDAPEFEWSEDGKTCQVIFTCINDSSHIEIYDAAVTSEVEEPATCVAKGTTIYTASYGEFEDFKEIEDIAKNITNHVGDTKIQGAKEATYSEEGYTGDVYCTGCGRKISSSKPIAKLEHDLDAPEFEWSEDGKTCQVIFTGEEESEEVFDAIVTAKVKQPATCMDMGITTYTATYEGYKSVIELEDIDIDESCHVGDTELIGEKEATCGEAGYTGDVYCNGCGEMIVSGKVIEKLEHDFDTPDFIWSKDGKSCRVIFTCENDPKHKETYDAIITSEIEDGIITYTATYEDYEDIMEVEVTDDDDYYYEEEEIVEEKVYPKGTKIKNRNGITFKITKAGTSGGTVELIKISSSRKSFTVPETITAGGIQYKVTSIGANTCKGNKKITKVTIGKNISQIGKNAFKGCKKLKTITIKSTKLTAKNVGNDVFKDVNNKAIVKVPSKKLKEYKKMLKKKGVSGKDQKIK